MKSDNNKPKPKQKPKEGRKPSENDLTREEFYHALEKVSRPLEDQPDQEKSET